MPGRRAGNVCLKTKVSPEKGAHAEREWAGTPFLVRHRICGVMLDAVAATRWAYAGGGGLQVLKERKRPGPKHKKGKKAAGPLVAGGED